MNRLHCIIFTTKLKANALATGEASAKVKIYAIRVRLAGSYKQAEEKRQRQNELVYKNWTDKLIF
ncbi:hypothetical protein MASR2M12_22070 [Bacteroidales bacterium]